MTWLKLIFSHDFNNSMCRHLLDQAVCCKVLISTNAEQCLQHPPASFHSNRVGQSSAQGCPVWAGVTGVMFPDGDNPAGACCQAPPVRLAVVWNLPEPKDLCSYPSAVREFSEKQSWLGSFDSLGLLCLLCRSLSFQAIRFCPLCPWQDEMRI